PVFSMWHAYEGCRICLHVADTHLQYAPPALRHPASVCFCLFSTNCSSHFRRLPAPGTCAESETNGDARGSTEILRMRRSVDAHRFGQNLSAIPGLFILLAGYHKHRALCSGGFFAYRGHLLHAFCSEDGSRGCFSRLFISSS